jgi:peptide/nickel transport system ATP-binding protein
VSSGPGAATPDPLLDVRGLVTRYLGRGGSGRGRTWVTAVDGVDLTVRAGELVAIVGESGSGKTTAAQSVMRMIDLHEGEVRLEGRDISALSNRRLRPLRRRMQMIFQDPYESLDPRDTVYDAVLEPLVIHREPREGRAERVMRALERAGLTPAELFADRYPHQLSGGQRQRVAIAAALVLEPELLVADEPVSMLDISVRAGVLNLLAELRTAGMAILMITHDLSTAAQYADRICVMYMGRIVEEGVARDVIAQPRHPYTRALVAAVPSAVPGLRSGVATVAGEPPSVAAVATGCRFHPRCPLAIPTCAAVDPALEPVDGGDVESDAPAGHRAACLRLDQTRP